MNSKVKNRAEYGKKLTRVLAEQLSKEFGNTYSQRNLEYYRKFYLVFNDIEILNACVQNLTWTHFRSLLRVDDDNARIWYMNESVKENWSSRTLDRNIGTQYYYRLLKSPQKEPVIQEMMEKITLTNGNLGGKMESFFNREKVNTGRQYNLDLLKALAIVAMIICHTVTILSGARTDYESEFGYWFADVFLGSYLAVAHAFMFCM